MTRIVLYYILGAAMFFGAGFSMGFHEGLRVDPNPHPGYTCELQQADDELAQLQAMDPKEN